MCLRFRVEELLRCLLCSFFSMRGGGGAGGLGTYKPYYLGPWTLKIWEVRYLAKGQGVRVPSRLPNLLRPSCLLYTLNPKP